MTDEQKRWQLFCAVVSGLVGRRTGLSENTMQAIARKADAFVNLVCGEEKTYTVGIPRLGEPYPAEKEQDQ